jgi:vacuolar protein sorting-associated protein 13A/C
VHLLQTCDVLQYQDVLQFLEAQERFTLALRYRKYRPYLREYSGHAREWWHCAYKCIIEEQIRRRKRNWYVNAPSQLSVAMII